MVQLIDAPPWDGGTSPHDRTLLTSIAAVIIIVSACLITFLTKESMVRTTLLKIKNINNTYYTKSIKNKTKSSWVAVSSSSNVESELLVVYSPSIMTVLHISVPTIMIGIYTSIHANINSLWKLFMGIVFVSPSFLYTTKNVPSLWKQMMNFLPASLFFVMCTKDSLHISSACMASKKQKKKKNHTCHIMNYRFVFGLVHLICLGCTSTAALDMEGVEKQTKIVIEKTEVGDVEKTDNIQELFNMKDNLKRLTKVSASSLLRGAAPGSPESIDASSTAMTDLKDVATSNLNFMEQMQELHMNGNKEALGGLMKSVLRDHKGFHKLVKEASDINPDLALPDDISLDNIPEGFDLESIPASVLADMYDPDMYDGMKEHARSLIPTLEDAELALHNLKEHHRRLEEEDEYDEFDFGPDYPSSSSSGTRYARGRAGNFKDFGSKFQQGGFNPLNFQNHPMMKNMMRGVKARFPRHLKKHFEGGGGARRESRRQLLEEDDDCREPCDIEDRQCNCNRLRKCAGDMQPYDFTVLFAGGFINEYGEFTIDADEVQLFDAKGHMPEKIARIKGLAANTNGDCNALLEEFHSACPRDQDTCNVVNDESFQLTVDQVCDAINTPTKLLVEEIAQAYDGFPNFAGGPFIDGTVDKEVIDWYTSQEVEEGGASGDWGSCDFRCQVEWLEANVTEVFPELRLAENIQEFNNCTASFEYCHGLMTTKLEQVDEEWSDLLEGSIDVTSSDIGNVQPPGSTSYSGGIWTLQGAGTIGGKSDNFRYTYVPSSGDVDVIIHIQSFSSTSSDASAGLMIRETLSANSPHFSVLLSNQRLQGFKRASEGAVAYGWSPLLLQGSSGVWLKISKTAGQNGFSIFDVDYSEVGESLETVRWIHLTPGGVRMANNFYVGMAIGALENDRFRAREFRVNSALVEESVQCDSISYNVCGEFVDAFDQMYNGRDKEKFPLENPMRRDVTKPIHPSSGIEALRLASFPIEYQVSVNDQGIKQLIPGEYDYADISADFPGEVSPSTGAWTLKQDEHWLRCGRYTQYLIDFRCYAGLRPRLESKDEIHAIKCCSLTSAQNEAPWGTPDCPDCIPNPADDTSCPYRLQMNSDKIPEVDRCKVGTFDEAVAFCSLHGGRLCSSEELEGNCAVDEGCGFDNELVWSGYTYKYSAETGCLSSQNNLVLSREAMKACDDSIALLVGSSTSVGMIKSLAELLASKSEDDTDPMPGTCCLDTPSSSEYFGHDYDPDEGMECQNTGPFHLVVSSEACENAGGRWSPSPCHTLKDCIDDRPTPDEGHCLEDESIACREDLSCPLFLNGTGTCSDPAESSGIGRCKSNDDCPMGSVCEDILDRDIQTQCLYDPGEFEKWAASFTIHNATNIEQCESARVELGFDRNELNDVQVCRQFDAYKCDPDSIFDLIDDETDGVSDLPPTTTKVRYPPYSPPPNEDLPWEDIHDKKKDFPLKDIKQPIGIRFYDEKRDKAVDALKMSKIYFKEIKEITKDTLRRLYDDADAECKAVFFGTPLLNFAASLCYLGLVIISNFLWLPVYLAKVAYYVTNLSYESLAITQPKYEKLTAKNLLEFDKWVTFALVTINKNINEQHTAMRNELQERHTIILNKVNSYTNCRVELHGIDVTRDPKTDPSAKDMLEEADENEGRKGDESCMCIIYNIGCSSGVLAENMIKVSMSGNHESVAIMKEFGDIEERDNQLQQSLHRIDLAVAAIEEKLDIVPDPKISKSKKSKKTKAIKPNGDAGEVQEEEMEEGNSGFFNRKLLETGAVGDEKAEDDNDEIKRSIVAMERKLGSIENKMTGIAMKDEVKEMKEKVDKIEKSMEELKDMLSKLVMGGGAAAE